MKYIYTYTTADNLDEFDQPIDETLVKHSSSVPKNMMRLSKWEAEEFEQIQIRNRAEMKKQVNQECQRRLIALTGAKDAQDLQIKVINANREATRLIDKKQRLTASLNKAEKKRLKELRAFDLEFEKIRAASNQWDNGVIPNDFKDDKYWNIAKKTTRVPVRKRVRTMRHYK